MVVDFVDNGPHQAGEGCGDSWSQPEPELERGGYQTDQRDPAWQPPEEPQPVDQIGDPHLVR